VNTPNGRAVDVRDYEAIVVTHAAKVASGGAPLKSINASTSAVTPDAASSVAASGLPQSVLSRGELRTLAASPCRGAEDRHMEIEATATTEVTGLAVSVASDVSAHAEGFGTRPQTGRPHSINLFGPSRSDARDGPSRGLDVLLGVGIGAAVMYYLDPDGGPRRRGLVREKIVDAVTMAPDSFEAAAHEVSRWARQTLEAHAHTFPSSSHHDGGVRWTPGSRLVASALGGALTLLAARRHDALGAAVGLVGSALLARGVRWSARQVPAQSEAANEPVGRELGDAFERPRLLEEM
jgi:hypothetical protein